jgi:signal transduction histidine kinase
MTRLGLRRRVVAAAALGLTLVAIIGCNSVRRIGRTFPSFLVMQNRVVASVTLGDWLAIDPSRLFQNEVVAVDGVAVRSSEAVYDLVQRRPPGTTFTYTLRTPAGESHDERVPSRRFSGWDFARLFAAYLFTGFTFIATGLVVLFLTPESAAARGLLACSIGIGLYALTGADLYGPHWFFRVHVAAESLATAGLIHLALVFPTDRLRGRSRSILTVVYAPFLLLAAVYERVLASPPDYTVLHLAALSAHALGAGALILSTAWEFARSSSPLIRRRIGVVALGAFAGFVVPLALSAASALIGGAVPVNVAAFTVFLFPLSLGYAILRRDLFEIDSVLRRAINYVVVGVTIAVAYALVILLAGLLVPSRELVVSSPFLLAAVNTVLVFLVVPLRARSQAAVDRLFFRNAYDASEALSELSGALAAVESMDAVVSAAARTLASTLAPSAVELRLRENDGRFVRVGAPTLPASEVALPDDLVQRLGAGGVIARYEWDDGSERALPEAWHELGAELLVPIRDPRGLGAILVLGQRRSGRAYAGPDVAFLRTVASQMALAIEDVRLLQRLEQKQASLMRADRLATLGRLTSGLAHEMGGPIGAVLSALRVLEELGQEYKASIDEPSVAPADHREIAAEMITTARNATEWTERASAFLKRITSQSRDPHSTAQQRFLVSSVVSETSALLAHRLRASAATLEFQEDGEPVAVVGDPASLGQVLTNLVGNALDAYEDAGRTDRRLVVGARRDGRRVLLSVRDWAGGMPPETLARIFDELYTTKEVGRGTGLGLWISRNLIEQCFGGTLEAESELGIGSCFTATLPLASAPLRVATSDSPDDRDRAVTANVA